LVLARAADIMHASAANMPQSFALSPMTHVPSFAFAHANASGEDQTRCEGRTGPQSGRGPVCGMSWEFALTVFAPALPSPLRKTAPYGRPVHRLGDRAGRSPGSRVSAYWSGLPSCPVAVLDLRLAAHSCGGSHGNLRIRNARIPSVRVPSFVPGITRGTNTIKCSLEP